MAKKHIYFFIGTTAEFIKLAPVIKEFKRKKIKIKVITSGQVPINFKELQDYTGKIPIDIAFKEKPHHSSIILFVLWMIKTLFTGFFILQKEFKNKQRRNTYVIVHGDTASALLGALFAKLFLLRLVHVEAGLRSFDFFEPFPEEIIRFIINYISDFNFAQNEWAAKNLTRTHGKIINTKQNTLIEPCKWAINKKRGMDYVHRFGNYYILIMHRQEHVYFNTSWTREMLNMVIENADKNLNCVFIMHSLTSRFLKSEKLNEDPEISKRILLVPRLPYQEFMTLLNNAAFIATDGCTNQEEVYYMGLPCLALRERTERTEGLNENVILSKGKKSIIKAFLKNYKKHRREPVVSKERPSKIIVDYILNLPLSK